MAAHWDPRYSLLLIYKDQLADSSVAGSHSRHDPTISLHSWAANPATPPEHFGLTPALLRQYERPSNEEDLRLLILQTN